jgi:hypothetical protein
LQKIREIRILQQKTHLKMKVMKQLRAHYTGNAVSVKQKTYTAEQIAGNAVI